VGVGRLSAVAFVGLFHLAAASAGAQERFKFGATEFTFAGGYSLGHATVDAPEVQDVNGFQLLPSFGIFLSDEHGPPWIRGNFEFLVEPTLVTLRAESEQGTGVGVAALARWVFATPWVVRPYVEMGLGVLGGHFDLQQTNCGVNFILEVGPGLLWFISERTAITAGYRFQHISNASLCSQNVGINSSLFILGVSQFFP
jgi:Lipid A 3-O-deacylase (PagL)